MSNYVFTRNPDPDSYAPSDHLTGDYHLQFDEDRDQLREQVGQALLEFRRLRDMYNERYPEFPFQPPGVGDLGLVHMVTRNQSFDEILADIRDYNSQFDPEGFEDDPAQVAMSLVRLIECGMVFVNPAPDESLFPKEIWLRYTPEEGVYQTTPDLHPDSIHYVRS